MQYKTGQFVLMTVGVVSITVTFIAELWRRWYSPKVRGKRRHFYITLAFYLRILSLSLALISVPAAWWLSHIAARANLQKIAVLELAQKRQSNKILYACGNLKIWLQGRYLDGNGYHEITGTTSYLAFGKKQDLVLAMRSSTILAHVMTYTSDSSLSLSEITAFYDCTSPDAEVPGSLRDLRQANIIQIGFAKSGPAIPNGTMLTTGHLTCVINQSIRFSVNVPPQAVTSGTVYIPNVEELFANLPE